jgi:predicted site-specific integrase-resolvase
MEKKENRRAKQRARVDAAQKLQNWLAQGWLTSRDLSERLGLTRQRIQQLRVKGRLPGAIRIGKHWVFPHDAVAILGATKGQKKPKAPGLRAQMRAERWLTTRDVAERTGLAQCRVLKLTKSGKLAGTQRGSQWFYQPDDVELFRAQQQEQHRAMAQMRADGWLTAKQAVQLLGVSYPLVLHYRKSGKLAGTRIGAQWFFRPDDVETLRAQREQREQREQRPRGGMVETIERMRAEGWLNTKDVAERLGVSYQSALSITKSGQLAATRTGSHLFYRPDDVETLRAQREHDDMVARQQRDQVPGATQVGGRWIFPRYAVQRSTTGPAGSNP